MSGERESEETSGQKNQKIAIIEIVNNTTVA